MDDGRSGDNDVNDDVNDDDDDKVIVITFILSIPTASDATLRGSNEFLTSSNSNDTMYYY